MLQSLAPSLTLLLSVIAGKDTDLGTRDYTLSHIEELRQRQPGAWRRLFEMEGDAVYRYVYGRVGSHADAEDLVATVFEEAWKHADTLRDQGLPARAWLFGIARHVVGTHHRRLYRKAPTISLDAFTDVAARIESTDVAMDLVTAMGKLKPQLAEVVAMRFIHGLSLKEAAVALNTTVDAVKRRQARGIEELRAHLAPPRSV